jgi:hypothetical protein
MVLIVTKLTINTPFISIRNNSEKNFPLSIDRGKLSEDMLLGNMKNKKPNNNKKQIYIDLRHNHTIPICKVTI